MRYYGLRRTTGEYTLEQENDAGMVYKQVVARDSLNPDFRKKLDANVGKRVDAMA